MTASPLKLSAALTDGGSVRVTLANLSNGPLVVWKPGNSFHHDSFRIEASVGRKWVPVAQRPVYWKQNSPVCEALSGGRSLAFTIEASAFALPTGSSQLRIRYVPVPYPDAKNAEGRTLFRKTVISAPILVRGVG